jgi:hypothetical protein
LIVQIVKAIVEEIACRAGLEVDVGFQTLVATQRGSMGRPRAVGHA